MNNTKLRVSLALSIIIIFSFACKKKYLNDNGPMQPGPNLVTHIIYEFHRSNLDWTNYADYFYDQSNRVTLYRLYQVDGATRLTDTFHTISFSYSNNGTLPSGSVEKYLNDHDLIDTVVHEYSYDNEGRLVLDTLTAYSTGIQPSEPGFYISRRMDYRNGDILVHNINYNRNNGGKESFNDTVKIDPNKNSVATSTLFATTFLNPSTVDVLSVGFSFQTFTYSSLPNIFNNLNVKGVLAFVETGHVGGYNYYSIYLGNNMVESSTFTAPGLPGPYPASYDYTSNPSNGNRVEKILITYQDGVANGTILYK